MIQNQNNRNNLNSQSNKNNLNNLNNQNNQKDTKHILFYSNFCQFSNEVYKKIEKMNIKDRFILINYDTNRDINLYNIPNGKIIGIIKKNNILDLNVCILNWCKVTQNKFSGWLLKKNIWGVYDTEIYNVKFYQPLVNQYWKILNSRPLN